MTHIFDETTGIQENTVITIGNFDGLHIGHQQLIETTKKIAAEQGYLSTVFTFYPHPMFVLNNRETAALIMSYEEKKFAVEKTGVDCYVEYPFSQGFSTYTPTQFVEDVLIRQFKAKAIVVGEGYRFGREGSGNIELLQQLGERHEAEIICEPSVILNGERVSSSRIRQYLKEKDLESANQLLTQPYFIIGTVMQGKKIGRTIGFPTINVLADPLKLFPPNGVYATRTLYGGKYYEGITNIGYNPTVSGSVKTIETHLFDFQQFVYGQTVQTHFYTWIRDEIKFESVEKLKLQIEKDSKKAKLFFLDKSGDL